MIIFIASDQLFWGCFPDGENRSRSSCTSRTSCSSASVSTSNTTGSDDTAADAYRPLLNACRSDASRVSDQTSAAATKLGQRGSAAYDHAPHASSCSRRHRGTNGVTSEESCSRFYPCLTSSSSAVPLLSSPVSAGVPFPTPTAPAAVALPVTLTSSTLATSGSRDGVYVLRSGHTQTSSCRYRVTSHRVLLTRRKVVRLLIAVLSTFALCVLPFHIRVLLRYWMPGSSVWVTGLPKYIAQVSK